MGGYTLIGELKEASFSARSAARPSEDGKTPMQHVAELISAARMLRSAAKAPPQSGANPLVSLKAKQQEIAKVALPADPKVITSTSSLEDRVIADILADACLALNAGCFAAGTKLLTRSGWRPVETIDRGEEVASRHEADPSGEVAWKVVEDTFQRTGCVLHVHVGGEVIRTTPEHPFFVEGKGWIAAGSLAAGDRIATLSGEWVAVEEVFDTGEWEPVYNLRVADYHTYFVGDEHWGFAAWAHNAYAEFAAAVRAAKANPPTSQTIKRNYDKAMDHEEKIQFTTVSTLYAWLKKQGITGGAADNCVGQALKGVALNASATFARFAEHDSPTMTKQQHGYTCVAACAKQLLTDLASKSVTEHELAAAMGTNPRFGTEFNSAIAATITTFDDNKWKYELKDKTLPDLTALTAQGPFIASIFIWLGGRGIHHAVIVDGVTADGKVLLRDPSGASPTSVSGCTEQIWADHFLSVWTGQSIYRTSQLKEG